jgi:outer membrane protein OmpA-like peptidoglycan-associated protein
MAIVTLATLLSAGCATKGYVGRTIDPVSHKVDEVATKADQQGQTLDQTRQTLDQTRQTQEKDETQLSATNERAVSAGSRADQAQDSANQAKQSASQAGESANQANQKADKLDGDLRNVVANLDAYKQVSETTVNFKFNSDKLNPEAKQALDQMAQSQNQYKRFFIAVEGFTDKAGSAEYNEALSRRRADAVVEYLVGQHDMPIYRIHMVGLGKMKPVEDASTRAAGAKNRRVEVTLYSADDSLALQSQR